MNNSNLKASLANALGAEGPNNVQQQNRKTSSSSATFVNTSAQSNEQLSYDTSINEKIDSTDESTSEASDDPSNPQLHRDEQDEACLPFLRKLGFVKNANIVSNKPIDLPIYESYVIASHGGLLGTDVRAEFLCVNVPEQSKFYAQIGSIDISLFTKSTLMNLCNFAEEKGASEIIFMLDQQHDQKKQYGKLMKMVDAIKLGTQDIWNLFGKGIDDASAKETRAETSFFLMELN